MKHLQIITPLVVIMLLIAAYADKRIRHAESRKFTDTQVKGMLE